MLYVSTRSQGQTFAPAITLQGDTAPDGGVFVPHTMPCFSKEEIFAFKKKSFAETIAEILNLFFTTGINSWDVEFCVGRYPYKIIPMHHRSYVAELWNNLASEYTYFEKGLYEKLTENSPTGRKTTYWAKVAIHIAVLFGLFGDLIRRGIYEVDISVQTDEFIMPVAAWYARSMGLPIKKIVCVSDKSHMFWDLIHRGECHIGVLTTDLDVQFGIENLLYGVYGAGEAAAFVKSANQRCSYILPEEEKNCLTRDFYVSVVSDDRVTATLRSIYQIQEYYAAPMTALAFSGLQDYRARTGESRNALLLSLSSPVFFAERLSAVFGCSIEEIKSKIQKA